MEKRKTKSLSKTSKERIKNYSVVRNTSGYYFVTDHPHLFMAKKYYSLYSIVRSNMSSKEAFTFSDILNKLKRK